MLKISLFFLQSVKDMTKLEICESSSSSLSTASAVTSHHKSTNRANEIDCSYIEKELYSQEFQRINLISYKNNSPFM